ncbi:DM13 domain-containing protein [Streptomyces torulosus]|uniref:DM13 domain-containing protein n=1 Tax=Streptomyces torulosus TaxID=68276 RepID=UPI0006EBCC28|nr:DM13 domain-containing protein [Streptomyces torulosus]
MGRKRRTPLITGLTAMVVVALAAGLYWFQPWKLWQDETVTEALPGTVVDVSRDPAAEPGESPSGSAPTGPVTVSSGDLISHEHTTTGTVRLVRLADGTHVLRLERLDTSNGPDLRVWLTDAPVKEGRAGWHVFDDGAHVSLGKLKGNKGSQNYPLPDGVDSSRYTSVTIWCDRFDVSFGAAALTDEG